MDKRNIKTFQKIKKKQTIIIENILISKKN